MTMAEREQKIAQNKEKYGLMEAEIEELRLPKKKHLSGKSGSELVLTLDQIFHPKSNFSTLEKIHHLHNLRDALHAKLERVEKKSKRIQKEKDAK